MKYLWRMYNKRIIEIIRPYVPSLILSFLIIFLIRYFAENSVSPPLTYIYIFIISPIILILIGFVFLCMATYKKEISRNLLYKTIMFLCLFVIYLFFIESGLFLYIIDSLTSLIGIILVIVHLKNRKNRNIIILD